jgi:hypothetical protein
LAHCGIKESFCVYFHGIRIFVQYTDIISIEKGYGSPFKFISSPFPEAFLTSRSKAKLKSNGGKAAPCF